MFESNLYNIDRDFDYGTVKAIVIKSLEKIAKEEAALKSAMGHYDHDSIDDKPNNVI